MDHEQEQSLNEERQFARRLIAVLDYDGIPKQRRAAFLADAGKISRSTAYRLLKASRAPRRLLPLAGLADALDVSWVWLVSGKLEYMHLRNMRILIQGIKGYPKEDTDRMMRVFMGCIAGHRKAKNLMNLVEAGELSLPVAAGLL